MEKCKVNVMMFGGRRCGKTSVIAAMRHCMEEKFGEDSSITMTESNSLVDVLTKKKAEILNFLDGTEKVFVPEEGKTTDESEYEFDVSIKGKKGSVSLSFYDYPGEWLGKPEYDSRLKEQAEISNIFMIAIDTPMLMEESQESDPDKIGRYNSITNKSAVVCNAIKVALQEKEYNSEMPPLIMFVPLKCEKYYNEERMNIVKEKVKRAYKELFNFFGGANENNFEVVIAPILTFGKNTAQFSRFDSDEEGNIIEDAEGKPEKSYYIRLNAKDKSGSQYNPEYCEQPLLYALEYLLYMARKQKENGKFKKNWFVKLLKIFSDFFKLPSANDFLEQEEVIRKKLCKDVDGYEIVYNPMHL